MAKYNPLNDNAERKRILTMIERCEKEQEVKRLWKKVTPIPIEFNGNGYLWDCTKCGYCLTSWQKYPNCKCPRCGSAEQSERSK